LKEIITFSSNFLYLFFFIDFFISQVLFLINPNILLVTFSFFVCYDFVFFFKVSQYLLMVRYPWACFLNRSIFRYLNSLSISHLKNLLNFGNLLEKSHCLIDFSIIIMIKPILFHGMFLWTFLMIFFNHYLLFFS